MINKIDHFKLITNWVKLKETLNLNHIIYSQILQDENKEGSLNPLKVLSYLTICERYIHYSEIERDLLEKNGSSEYTYSLLKTIMSKNTISSNQYNLESNLSLMQLKIIFISIDNELIEDIIQIKKYERHRGIMPETIAVEAGKSSKKFDIIASWKTADRNSAELTTWIKSIIYDYPLNTLSILGIIRSIYSHDGDPYLVYGLTKEFYDKIIKSLEELY